MAQQKATPSERTGVILAALAQVALLVAALRDIKRRPAIDIRGHKGVWVLVSFVNYIGPIAYFLFGRKRS